MYETYAIIHKSSLWQGVGGIHCSLTCSAEPVFIVTAQVCSEVPQCTLASAARNILGFLLILVIVCSGFLLMSVFLWNPPSHPGPIHSFPCCVYTCLPTSLATLDHNPHLRSHSLDDQMRNTKRGLEWKVGSSLSSWAKAGVSASIWMSFIGEAGCGQESDFYYFQLIQWAVGSHFY